MYTARYTERKPGLDKSQGCWCCIILYYPLISMYYQKYKKLSWTRKDGPVSQTSFLNWFLGNLAPPVSLSHSPSLFFSGWIPIWNVEAHQVYLIVLAFKFRERESPRRGTLRYSNRCRSPNLDGANLLFWDFIGFPHKPSYWASFLHSIFLLYYFFLISFYISI